MIKKSSLKGVLQTTTGIPVAEALIMIKEGSHEFNDIASISNELGEFAVSGIEIPGTYTLLIQHPSGSFTKTIAVSSPDKVIHLEI